MKWKNLNPVYNEEFAFETRPTELYIQSLYITVFDKDYGKSNDYLGGLILGGSGSKGEFILYIYILFIMHISLNYLNSLYKVPNFLTALSILSDLKFCL